MSGIIKSGNLAEISAVQSIIAQSSTAPVVSLCRQDEERDRLHRRIAMLEEEVRQHDAATDILRDAVRKAFEDGKVEGHKAGLSEAQDRQSERLSLLEEAMEKAQTKLSNTLASLSRLSTLLARDCVDMILGRAEDRAEFIGRIIEAQISKIDKAALLTIELSKQDFSDDEMLAVLAARIDLPAVTLMAQPGMRSGGCVMTLRLGAMDVGINQQWDCLRDVLGEMSLPPVQT